MSDELQARIADTRRRLAKAERRREGRTVKLSESIEALKLALDPELRAYAAECADHEREAAYDRRIEREDVANHHYGMRRGAFPCQSCGKFKSDAAAVCGWCGDDPVSHNGDRRNLNRAHGYAE